MNLTLSNFYTSKQWEKLIAQLKLERVNADGQVICEYCGNPITKAYDIIGHHVEELTVENVNDYNVSLNPDNIMLIHFRCHNKIHERFEGFRQRVWLVWGSPCAGKSTWVHNSAHRDDLIVDIDNIWESVCTSDKLHKPARLKPVVFKIRDAMLDTVKTRQGMWRNAYIIGTYPLKSDRDRLCQILGAEEIHIDTSKAECLERAPTEEYKKFIADYWAAYTP